MKAHSKSSDDTPARESARVLSLFDAHCHLDFEAFDGDRDAVLARARDVGVERLAIAGRSPETASRTLALRSEHVLACVGLHPWALADADESADEARLDHLSLLAEEADALGEVGLDALLADRADRGGVSLKRQERVARRAMAIASRHALPVVLHVVRAHEAMLAMVDAEGAGARTMVHAFSASRELAREWTRRGALLSFGTAVLDPRSRRARESVASIPIDSLLVESDATGRLELKSGAKTRLEPSVVRDVVAAIAELRGTSADVVAEASYANAQRFFRG